MTKHVEPQPSTPHELRKVMSQHGFTAVVFIARPISSRPIGSVESWHRSIQDAKRFAHVLNKLYGCDRGYLGVSV